MNCTLRCIVNLKWRNMRYNRRDYNSENETRRLVSWLMGKKYGPIILVVLILLAAVAGYLYHNGYFGGISADANAEYHFIDIGQGDASLILTDEAAVLVDCGTLEQSHTVVDYVSRYTDKIDLFVFSHAHDDHMGGAANIINSIEVGEVLMTSYASDAVFFEKALDAIEDNNVKVTEALPGGTYTVGDVNIEVFSPAKDYEDHNANSIIMRVEVDGSSVMYTGDAEHRTEKDVLEEYGYSLRSDILKVGHHGSSTSTSEEFFEAVSPSYGVISCGADNSYGHPHREIKSFFEDRAFEYYRTDLAGDVVFVVENGEISVRCGK